MRRHARYKELLNFFVAQVLGILLKCSTGRAEKRVNGSLQTYDKNQGQKIAL